MSSSAVPVPVVPTLANNFVPQPADYPSQYFPNGYPYPVYAYGMPVLTETISQIPLSSELLAEPIQAPAGLKDSETWNLQQVVGLAQLLARTQVVDGAIAAPQAGVPYAMFIINTTSSLLDIPYPNGAVNPYPTLPAWQGGGTTPQYQVFINPQVTPLSVADMHANGVNATIPANTTNLPSSPSDQGSDFYLANEGCMSYPNFADVVQKMYVYRPKCYKFSFTTIIYSQPDPHTPPQATGLMHFDGSPGGQPPLYIWTTAAPEDEWPQGTLIAGGDLQWVIPHETDHTQGILFTDLTTSPPRPFGGLSTNQSTYLTDMKAGISTIQLVPITNPPTTATVLPAAYPMVAMSGYTPGS